MTRAHIWTRRPALTSSPPFRAGLSAVNRTLRDERIPPCCRARSYLNGSSSLRYTRSAFSGRPCEHSARSAVRRRPPCTAHAPSGIPLPLTRALFMARSRPYAHARQTTDGPQQVTHARPDAGFLPARARHHTALPQRPTHARDFFDFSRTSTHAQENSPASQHHTRFRGNEQSLGRTHALIRAGLLYTLHTLAGPRLIPLHRARALKPADPLGLSHTLKRARPLFMSAHTLRA